MSKALPETETIDKLFLELSQFSTAKTHKEIELERENAEFKAKLTAIVLWLENNQPDVFRHGLWEAITRLPGRPW